MRRLLRLRHMRRSAEFAQRNVGLVLLDLDMRVTDSRQLYKQLQAERPSVPVIFVSGDSTRAATEATGAAGYLQKPFGVREVTNLMERFEPKVPETGNPVGNSTLAVARRRLTSRNLRRGRTRVSPGRRSKRTETKARAARRSPAQRLCVCRKRGTTSACGWNDSGAAMRMGCAPALHPQSQACS